MISRLICPICKSCYMTSTLHLLEFSASYECKDCNLLIAPVNIPIEKLNTSILETGTVYRCSEETGKALSEVNKFFNDIKSQI